jgi:hypothetical protein
MTKNVIYEKFTASIKSALNLFPTGQWAAERFSIVRSFADKCSGNVILI